MYLAILIYFLPVNSFGPPLDLRPIHPTLSRGRDVFWQSQPFKQNCKLRLFLIIRNKTPFFFLNLLARFKFKAGPFTNNQSSKTAHLPPPPHPTPPPPQFPCRSLITSQPSQPGPTCRTTTSIDCLGSTFSNSSSSPPRPIEVHLKI
jgi:hypothetical protein